MGARNTQTSRRHKVSVVTILAVIAVLAIVAAILVHMVGSDGGDNTLPTNPYGGYNEVFEHYEPDVVFIYGPDGRTKCSILVSSDVPWQQQYRMGCGDRLGEYVDLD